MKIRINYLKQVRNYTPEELLEFVGRKIIYNKFTETDDEYLLTIVGISRNYILVEDIKGRISAMSFEAFHLHNFHDTGEPTFVFIGDRNPLVKIINNIIHWINKKFG